jgi:predicted Zn-dependent protease
MLKTILRLLLLGITVCLASGCHTVPYSDRTRFLATSESEEARMGLDAWNEVLQSEKVSSDPFLNHALKRVGGAIAAVSGRSDFNWEFKVFDSETANAYCLPGGKVGVYTALYRYTANDAELATVVSHEIAHAICRHGGERVSQNLLQTLGAALLSTATDSEAVMVAYGAATQYGALLPFSRKHESEADYVGLLLMAKAGYDPRQSIAFWRKFGDQESSKLMEYVSTHPHGTTRIEGLQEKMPEALKLYEQSPRKGLGTVYSQKDLSAALPR